MNKSTLTNIITLLCIGALAQEQEILIKGSLINKEDQSPVAFAHIINRKSSSLTVSSIEGKFEKRMQQGDTLHVSIIGFEPYTFYLTHVPHNNIVDVIIELIPSSNLLEAVKVYAFIP